MPSVIQFFNEFNEDTFIVNEIEVVTWLKSIIKHFKKDCGEINYIFVDEKQMVDINTKYLNHTYPTDIITFNYNEGDTVSSDIYICPSVIKENSLHYHVTFLAELHRVLVHGVLHLIGFNDHSEEEKKEMREMEDYSLSLL